jgi:hypothetical protein
VVKEERLRVGDAFKLDHGKKVVLEFNELGQPVGESGGLFGGFLGSIAANCNAFPISYDNWREVSKIHKDLAFRTTIAVWLI